MMKFEQNPSEAILYKARLHWIIFILPFFFMILSGATYSSKNIIFLPLSLFCLAFLGGIHRLLLYHFSSLIITESTITIQTGIIFRKTWHATLSQLESVDITQSLLGSILNYGCFSVRGTGGTYACFAPVANPLTCRRFIETR